MNYVIFFIALIFTMFVSYVCYSYDIDYWHRLTKPAKIILFLIPIIFWSITICIFFNFIL